MINSPVDEIKSRLDVVDVVGGYIRLSKAGRNYRALCPFHSEKTPSFFVSPERQMWYCFGCQKGGSIFDFVMQMDGLEFGDALKVLAQRAGVELKKIDPKLSAKWKTEKTRLYEICELAAKFFERQLEAGKTGQSVQKYLKERGLKSKTIQEWRIGYGPDKWQALSDFLKGRGYGEEEIERTGLSVRKDEIQNSNYDRFRNRIIFPIYDLNGGVVGFSGRIFGEGEPKYLNTPNTLIYDKSRVLYGLDRAKLDIRKDNFCVLVEGQMDVIMSHQAGVRNAVASSGTALTVEHLKIIKRYTENLAMAFDMDLAGETATKRSIDLAVSAGFDTKVIEMPVNQDPADCLKNNPPTWLEAIKKARSVMEFYFSIAFSKFTPGLAEGKREIAKIILPVLKRIPNKIEQSHWLSELGKKLKTEEKILIEEMKKIKEQKFGETRLAAAASAETDFQKKRDNFKIKKERNNTEEYLLALLFAYPDLSKDFKTQPSYLFTNSDLAELFKKIKRQEAANSEDIRDGLPADLADRINYLVFKNDLSEEARGEISDDFNPKKEIEFCFSQLKDRYCRQRLSQINLAIKEAENPPAGGKKDKISLKKLTEEFNKLCKQMS